MNTFVTKEDLADACLDQVATFATEWPDGAEISAANIMRAVELGLDLDWWAERHLSTPALAAYKAEKAQALAAHKAATAPAWAAYKAATAPAWAAYEAATAQALIAALNLDVPPPSSIHGRRAELMMP